MREVKCSCGNYVCNCSKKDDVYNKKESDLWSVYK